MPPRLQKTDEGVRFLIEQGKLSPEVRRMIMDAPPGEVIEWNFPEGLVPMARVNEQGMLSELGGGLGGALGGPILHITQQGYDQALGFGLDWQKRLAIQERTRLIAAQAVNKPPDPSVQFEQEVRKHFPKRDDGKFSVMAFYEHSAKGHRVSVWWNVGTKNPDHLGDNLNAACKGPLPAEVVAEAKRRLAGAGTVSEAV